MRCPYCAHDIRATQVNCADTPQGQAGTAHLKWAQGCLGNTWLSYPEFMGGEEPMELSSCRGSKSRLPLPCVRFSGRVSYSRVVTLLEAPPPQSQSSSGLLSLRPPSLNPGSQTVPCRCSPMCLAGSCHHVIGENVPSHLGTAHWLGTKTCPP